MHRAILELPNRWEPGRDKRLQAYQGHKAWLRVQISDTKVTGQPEPTSREIHQPMKGNPTTRELTLFSLFSSPIFCSLLSAPNHTPNSTWRIRHSAWQVSDRPATKLSISPDERCTSFQQEASRGTPGSVRKGRAQALPHACLLSRASGNRLQKGRDGAAPFRPGPAPSNAT